MSKINIAIDGPAAAGKSTIAKLVASELNYKYLDTGAMYRAVTYFALNNHEPLSETNIRNAHINFDSNGAVLLNNQDVTEAIRNTDVTNHVSEYASLNFVRNYLTKMQQVISKQKGVVMDGRDIGTVVIPDAELKIYLTASAEVRAKRRLKEEKARGNEITLDDLTNEIIKRDESDMNRTHSPLKQAEDAIVINTDHLTIDEVSSKIITLGKERIEKICSIK